jgi:hypothetical protein
MPLRGCGYDLLTGPQGFGAIVFGHGVIPCLGQRCASAGGTARHQRAEMTAKLALAIASTLLTDTELAIAHDMSIAHDIVLAIAREVELAMRRHCRTLDPAVAAAEEKLLGSRLPAKRNPSPRHATI